MLRQSPYVAKVTNKTVRFTQEFKELFHQRVTAGAQPTAVFEECGIDTDVVGIMRIRGFTQNLERVAARGEGFEDRRAVNKDDGPRITLRKRLANLEKRVAYLEELMGITGPKDTDGDAPEEA